MCLYIFEYFISWLDCSLTFNALHSYSQSKTTLILYLPFHYFFVFKIVGYVVNIVPHGAKFLSVVLLSVIIWRKSVWFSLHLREIKEAARIFLFFWCIKRNDEFSVQYAMVFLAVWWADEFDSHKCVDPEMEHQRTVAEVLERTRHGYWPNPFLVLSSSIQCGASSYF